MLERIAPRLFAVPTSGGQANPFLVGPDREPDLRSRRPYFLLPLLGARHAQLTHGAVMRIRQWIRSQGRPITDVYILSHGWHRNFFSAVAAYDRLVVALQRLVGRGAIEPRQDHNPLFIAVHWHSDPGENLWLDKEGRRSKAGFMERVRATFRAADPAKVSEATMERDFELMFDLLASLSAPDTDASGSEYDDEARGLAEVLHTRYRLRTSPDAGLDDKVAALWTCYYEAPSRRVLRTQDTPPTASATGLQGLKRLFGFVASSVPLLTLAGLLLNAPVPRLQVQDAHFLVDGGAPIRTVRRATMRDVGAMAWLAAGRVTMRGAKSVLTVAGLMPAIRESGPVRRLHKVRLHLAAAIGLAIASAALLSLVRLWRALFALNRPATAIPWLALVPWLYLQVVFSLPIIVYSLGGLVLSFAYVGALGQALRLVSDERSGLRNRPTARVPALSIGAAFAWLARLPVRWLKGSVALDSRFTNVAEMAEAQLAFYDMQERGVRTGTLLGDAVAEIWRDVPELKDARLHLAGHSFGGLVVANAGRRIAFNPDFGGDLRTITLIQGALASSWFHRETALLNRVSGAVAAIYSRYDTANGFWYPLANLGREAAGYVGLCGSFSKVAHHMPPMLVMPPPLGTSSASVKAINIDASRLIYDGSPAMGGGHGDIFKDDVIHVLWASMQQ